MHPMHIKFNNKQHLSDIYKSFFLYIHSIILYQHPSCQQRGLHHTDRGGGVLRGWGGVLESHSRELKIIVDKKKDEMI